MNCVIARPDPKLGPATPAQLPSAWNARLQPNGHQFVGQQAASVRQLHGIPFIGFSAQPALYFRERLPPLCTQFRIQPKIVHGSVMPTLLALVEAGVGVAVVPKSASGLRPGGVCYRPLADVGEAAAIDLYCAQRTDEHNPAVETLAKVLRSINPS